MPKLWQRVSMDADPEDMGGTSIIRIVRGRKGDPMASVHSLQWLEPDGHEHTGYAAGTQTGLRHAAEVIAEFKKVRAVIALQSDDLWDATWGDLMPTTHDST